MLGGMIVAARNTKEGTLIEILQKPLDTDGRPLDTDSSEGRFLVQSETFLDSAVYHPGRLATVVAEVIGRKEQPLDEIVYSYPLLIMKAPAPLGSVDRSALLLRGGRIAKAVAAANHHSARHNVHHSEQYQKHTVQRSSMIPVGS